MELPPLLVNPGSPFLYRIKNLIQQKHNDNLTFYLQHNIRVLLDLCKDGLISYLIKSAKSNTLMSVFNILKMAKIDYRIFIKKDDIEDACKKCSAEVIACLLLDENLRCHSDLHRLLLSVLQRDDPFLLFDLSQICPFLFDKSFFKCSNPLLSIFSQANTSNITRIMEELWVIFEAFNLDDQEAYQAIRFWKSNYSLPLPFHLRLYEENLFSSDSLAYEQLRTNYPDNEVNDLKIRHSDCVNAKNTVKEAARIRQIIKKWQNTEKVDIYHLIDASSPNLLVELPYLLMKHPEYMLHSELSFPMELPGIPATGTGPFQQALLMYYDYFYAQDFLFETLNDQGYYIPARNSLSNEEVHLASILYYGFGVVFLKTLIDLRLPSIKINTTHPLVFKSMLDRTSKSSESLIQDSFKYQPAFRAGLPSSLEDLPQYISDLGQDIESDNSMSMDLLKQLKTSLSTFLYNTNSTGVLYDCVRKGFNLEFDPDILPQELKSPIEVSKQSLSHILKEMNGISPSSIQFLLLGPLHIEEQQLLDSFTFKLFKHHDYTDDTKDVIDNRSKVIKRRTEDSVRACLKKWAAEDPQDNLEKFLKFIHKTPRLPQNSKDKFEFSISRDLSPNSLFGVHLCDFTIRIPVINSMEHFEQLARASWELSEIQNDSMND